MSDIDLDAIEARAEAATEGPWFVAPGEDEGDVEVWADRSPRGGAFVAYTGQKGFHGSDEEAEFIAHARTDVPALVAEVRRLTEPETVTTAADLDALPVGSVVLDPRGHALEKRHVPPDGFGITVAWYPSGSPGYLRRAPLPATVIHRGGDR